MGLSHSFRCAVGVACSYPRRRHIRPRVSVRSSIDRQSTDILQGPLGGMSEKATGPPQNGPFSD